MWWALAVAALAFTAWTVPSMSMAEVSLSCSKIGESQSFFRCEDRIVHVLGVWPLVGLGLLLATPPVVAALAMRKWVSWFAVAALVGLSIAGLMNWASTSYWGLLLFAVPLAVLGSIAAAFQRTVPRPGRQDVVLPQRRKGRAEAALEQHIFSDTLRATDFVEPVADPLPGSVVRCRSGRFLGGQLACCFRSP